MWSRVTLITQLSFSKMNNMTIKAIPYAIFT